MKKLFSLLMLVSIILFVSSCSDDDDGGNSNNTEDKIVGTWTIFEVEVSFTSEEDSDSVTIPTSVCSEDYIISFAANGDLTVSDIAIDFDEALDGNLDLACEVNGGELNGSWESTTGNSYIISIDGDALPATVNFTNGNNSFEVIAINDQTDDPFDPFTQTIILRGNRN
jgi:hypothetical protein